MNNSKITVCKLLNNKILKHLLTFVYILYLHIYVCMYFLNKYVCTMSSYV